MDRSIPKLRRDSEETKERILKAAQVAFSTKGYSSTGIRDLARTLGLSTTIILRYYGSKVELFEAAFADLLGQYTMPDGRAAFAKVMAETILVPFRDVSPLSMLAFAAAEPEAQAIAARLLEDCMVAWLADRFGPPDSRRRARQFMTLCFGFIVHNRLLNTEGQNAPIDAKTVAWLTDSLQALVDGD